MKIKIEEGEHCHCGCLMYIVSCETCQADYEIMIDFGKEIKFCPGCGGEIGL